MLELHREGERLRITVRDKTRDVAVSTDLSAVEIDVVIRMLSAFREKMDPRITSSPPKDLARGILDPRWAGLKSQNTEQRYVTIRHPGLGWLAFRFPAASARLLADHLLGRLVRKSENRTLQ